jgi:hypothetical protein
VKEIRLSYDLMVFDAKVAPHDRKAFMAWHDKQLELQGSDGCNDPELPTPALRSWFREIIEVYRPMNGPLASGDLDDPKVTDYCLGRSVIYAAFAWSEAKAAHKFVKELAAKHGVGFFDVSSDDGDIWLPTHSGELTKASSATNSKLAIWKRSETTKTAMLAEVYDAICEGRDHPAMAPFDLAALERALKDEFGDYENHVVGSVVCETGSTATASWLVVRCAASMAQSVVAKVVPVAIALDLLVYDPQRRCVWGNKRPPKKKKT